MKKHLFLKLFLVVFMFVLVGCGEVVEVTIDAPTGLKIENEILIFEGNENANSYVCEVTPENGTSKTVSVNPGDNVSVLNLSAGNYSLRVKAVGANGNESDWSDAITYSKVNKIATPSGLTLEGGYVFFNMVAATDQYILRFVNGETVIEREAEAGMAVAELVLPEGTYQVSIKAKATKAGYVDSDYSEPIEYTKVGQVMEFKERDLVSGGYIKWMGRTYYDEENKVNKVYHSASGFELFFKGSEVIATITATNYLSASARPCIVIVVDDDFKNAKTLFLDKATQDIALVSGNTDALEHKVALYKRSESIDSHIGVTSIRTDGMFIQKIENKPLKFEFIAASSSTGYGNLGSPSSSGKTTENSDALKGFAFLTAQAMNADVNIFSASGWGCAFSQWTSPNTINVPEAYEYTDFSSYKNKVEAEKWNAARFIPDVIVVNLGTNDWSYINAGSSATEKDARMNTFQKKYIAFLDYLHEIYPDAQIIVLYGLMNENNIFTATESIVAAAQVKNPSLASIKIIGDGMGYNSHPSAANHQVIANKLVAFIQELLNK
ncbi:MAG: hypothetical protein J5691_04465 [Bacilli bacterium]|nr:hypothetical protein [Bacilli bacterium]